jgi:hypothetical protein
MYLALFGLLMAVIYDAPWHLWAIGFLCIILQQLRKDQQIKEAVDAYDDELDSYPDKWV